MRGSISVVGSRRLGLGPIPMVLVALTVGRLAFVPAIIVAIPVSAILTGGLLALFVAMDLYDGVLARGLDADDPARRVLDSIVDRLSIWAVYAAIVAMGLLPLELFGLLLARDLYCGWLCHQVVRRQGVAIRADWMYRTLNLMLAGWVILAPLVESTLRVGLFLAAFALSVAVAVDLKRSVEFVLRRGGAIEGSVISASVLRADRSAGDLAAPIAVALPGPAQA